MKRSASIETEAFLRTFGDDPVTAHNLRCEMVARAIRAIGDSTKVSECWLYPNVNSCGYGVTSVLHKTYVTSRLVCCLATGKPYDYHNDDGEYMVASHRTPIICRNRNCLNPAHLFWETQKENCKRREAEARAEQATSELAAKAVLSILPDLRQSTAGEQR
jgi:hypothetical protein